MTYISVVIPHLNQPEDLHACLASLDAGTRAPDEIIVVDNGSDSLPEAVCAPRSDTRLLQEAAPGPGLARNTGAAAARGEILAFIDADCQADPGWLAAAAAHFEAPDVHILGGDIRVTYTDPARPTMTEAYEGVYGFRIDRYIAEEGFAATANMAVRRAALTEVGPFGGIEIAEDRDWGQRATAMGYRIRFAPDMRTFHPARPTIRALYRKWDRLLSHDYEAARQSFKGQIKWLLKALLLVPAVLWEIPKILSGDRAGTLRSKMLAIAGLVCVRAHRARRMLQFMVLGGHERGIRGWNRS